MLNTWDRGAPSPVAPNSFQSKEEEAGPQWKCQCGHSNPCQRSRCKECGQLRPEERMHRQSSRAAQGLGKGGGYFERDDAIDRRKAETDSCEAEGLDIYGRRRSGDIPTKLKSETSSGARNALTSAGPLPTKAERQKAALERLRNGSKKKVELSPPRVRTFRDPSSRSRSRMAKKGRKGFVLSGGIS
mmetsp:Transcript_110853/g.174792  ORF Transcript_110853/g.174792 Transcript_110853/m.174792 type:complete len:187 (+) Transcript_110853:34-594(+)